MLSKPIGKAGTLPTSVHTMPTWVGNWPSVPPSNAKDMLLAAPPEYQE